jgi:acyl-CoA dehydrogenase family member 9
MYMPILKFRSFLENLYFGDFADSLFSYEEPPSNDPEVAGFISKYHEVTKDYPDDSASTDGLTEVFVQKLKTTGFFGLLIRKDYGGTGLSLSRYLGTAKELVGQNMGILCLTHFSMGAGAIELFGNDSQKKKYLPQVSKGDMIFTHSISGTDTEPLDAVLSPDGKHYILNGSMTFMPDADYAGGMMVSARMDENKEGFTGSFIVEKDAEGISAFKSNTEDENPARSFNFKNVMVPEENLIGKPGDGLKISEAIRNRRRIVLGAMSAGILKASFEDMMFLPEDGPGRPVAGYGSAQAGTTNAFIENEAVWSMTNFTAGLIGHDPASYVTIESLHCMTYGLSKAMESVHEMMEAAGPAYRDPARYVKMMRCLNDASVFDGTILINSAYATVLMREQIYSQIKDIDILIRFLMLFTLKHRSSFLETDDQDRLIRRALKDIKRYSKMFRKTMVSSMIRYGKKLPDMDLILAGMTGISCRIYAMLSMTAKIKSMKKDSPEFDRTVKALEYYLIDSGNRMKRGFDADKQINN